MQYYSRVDASPEVRARAAFVVAGAFNFDKRYDDSDIWVRNALRMNDLTPAGSERDGRNRRYRDQLNINQQARTKPDSSGP